MVDETTFTSSSLAAVRYILYIIRISMDFFIREDVLNILKGIVETSITISFLFDKGCISDQFLFV